MKRWIWVFMFYLIAVSFLASQVFSYERTIEYSVIFKKEGFPTVQKIWTDGVKYTTGARQLSRIEILLNGDFPVDYGNFAGKLFLPDGTILQGYRSISVSLVHADLPEFYVIITQDKYSRWFVYDGTWTLEIYSNYPTANELLYRIELYIPKMKFTSKEDVIKWLSREKSLWEIIEYPFWAYDGHALNFWLYDENPVLFIEPKGFPYEKTPGRYTIEVGFSDNPKNKASETIIAYVNPQISETAHQIEEFLRKAFTERTATFTIHFKNVEDSSKGDYFVKYMSCSQFEIELYDPAGSLYDRTNGVLENSKCSATLNMPDQNRPGYWKIVVHPSNTMEFSSTLTFYLPPKQNTEKSYTATKTTTTLTSSTATSSTVTTSSRTTSSSWSLSKTPTRTESQTPRSKTETEKYISSSIYETTSPSHLFENSLTNFMKKSSGFTTIVGSLGILLVIGLIVGMPLLSAFFLLQGAKIAGIENPTFGKAITAVIVGGIAAAVLGGVIMLALPMLLPVGGIAGILIYLWVVKSVFNTTWDKALIAWIISAIIGIVVLIGVFLLLGVSLASLL